jgi:hypothetical protein
MISDPFDTLSLEEKRRVFDERLANGYYIRPWKPKAVVARISQRLTRAARANPDSLTVYVSAKADDGTIAIERVRLVEITDVAEG